MKNVYVVARTSNEMKRKSLLDVLFWLRNRLRSVESECTVSLRGYTTERPGPEPPGVGGRGGGGRTRRDSAGTFGEYGPVQEDSYFFKKQKEQLKELKKTLNESGMHQKKEDK